MTKKTLLYVLLQALLMAFLLFGGVSTCNSKKAVTEQARVAQVVRDADTQVDRQAAKRASKRAIEEKKTDAKVNKALQANSEWASQPLPDDVFRSLRD